METILNRFHNYIVVPVGVEPTTSCLEGKRSTTELRDLTDPYALVDLKSTELRDLQVVHVGLDPTTVTYPSIRDRIRVTLYQGELMDHVHVAHSLFETGANGPRGAPLPLKVMKRYL